MKHTPGPWKVDCEFKRDVYSFSPQIELVELLASVYSMRRAKGSGEANARLIAAAPELLSSVQEFLSLRQSIIDMGGAKEPFDPQMIEVFSQMQIEVVERAEAAIRKATGVTDE